MSQRVAYALRAEYEDDFVGATVAIGPLAHTLDVKEALEAGNGKIVADDDQIKAALETLEGESGPLLKHVAVEDAPLSVLPEGFVPTFASGDQGVPQPVGSAEEQTAELSPEDQAKLDASQQATAEHGDVGDYEKLPVDELRDIAEEREDVDVPRNASKERLVAALEAADEERKPNGGGE